MIYNNLFGCASCVKKKLPAHLHKRYDNDTNTKDRTAGQAVDLQQVGYLHSPPSVQGARHKTKDMNEKRKMGYVPDLDHEFNRAFEAVYKAFKFTELNDVQPMVIKGESYYLYSSVVKSLGWTAKNHYYVGAHPFREYRERAVTMKPRGEKKLLMLKATDIDIDFFSLERVTAGRCKANCYVAFQRMCYHFMAEMGCRDSEIAKFFGKHRVSILHSIRQHESSVQYWARYREVFGFAKQFYELEDEKCNTFVIHL